MFQELDNWGFAWERLAWRPCHVLSVFFEGKPSPELNLQMIRRFFLKKVREGAAMSEISPVKDTIWSVPNQAGGFLHAPSIAATGRNLSATRKEKGVNHVG